MDDADGDQASKFGDAGNQGLQRWENEGGAAERLSKPKRAQGDADSAEQIPHGLNVMVAAETAGHVGLLLPRSVQRLVVTHLVRSRRRQDIS